MFTCLLRGRSTPEIRAIAYPCLCLCFEFSQITRTTPLRCTILHLSQIFFTDARTFMILLSLLPRSCMSLQLRVLLILVNALASIYIYTQSARGSGHTEKAPPLPCRREVFG